MANSQGEVAGVALLRGVNVGGHNKLPMKDLARLFLAAGCSKASTFIQSGNVVFRADPEKITGLDNRVTEAIAEQFGFLSPVILRTGEELAGVMQRNPFLSAGAAEDFLHVMFLARSPSVERVRELDPQRSPGDMFAVHGREIYLYLPNGVGNSKLTNSYFDSKLKTVTTGRNWRTVTKLLELLRAL